MRKGGKDRGLRPVVMANGKVYWQARWYRGGKEYRSKAIPSKQEARDIYTKQKAEAREPAYFPALYQAKQAERVTVADLLALVVADYRRQGRKRISDALEMQRFWVGLAGDRKATTITGSQLTAWADEWIQDGYANSTANRRIEKLLRGYALAKEADLPLLLTGPKWKKLKENPARSGWMEWATFAQIREALPAHARVPVTLAFWTGMRMGEITQLRRAQVTFDDQKQGMALTLGGDQTKTSQARTIVWTGDLYETLTAWEQETARTFPFCRWLCHRSGKPLGTIDTAWKSACIKLGLATGTWRIGYWIGYRGPLLHDFRRTAVRNLDRAGVSRDIAKKITGHKTDSMYTRYNIVSEEDLNHAGAKVVSYLTGRKPDVTPNDPANTA